MPIEQNEVNDVQRSTEPYKRALKGTIIIVHEMYAQCDVY